MLTTLALVALGACTGELASLEPTRAGLHVPAGPRTVQELGISTWDLRLRSSGVEITAVGADGASRGSLSYAMKTERRTASPVLLVQGNLGAPGALRLSRRGVDDASLARIPNAGAWASALARDVAAASGSMEKYGAARACSELVRTGAHACARTVVICEGSSRDCVVAARSCARQSLAADRCQRRAL